MLLINLKQLIFTLIRLIKFEEKKVVIELKYTAFGKKKKRLKSAFFLCIDSY